MRSTGRHRRSARRDVAETKQLLDAALAQQAQVEQFVQPAASAHAKAAGEVRNLERLIAPTEQLLSWSDHAGLAGRLREVDEALTDWQGWAKGQRIPVARLTSVVGVLGERNGNDVELCDALAEALISWGREAGADLEPKPAADRSTKPRHRDRAVGQRCRQPTAGGHRVTALCDDLCSWQWS